MKNLLLITALAFLSTGVMAQQGLHLGVKGAPQSTWMFNADDSDNPNWLFVPTFRYSFGASMAYFFSDAVGLGIDLTYSAQGQRYELNDLNLYTKLNYFKIPVLFQFHSNAESTAMFYLHAGPQFGILMSATGEADIPFLGTQSIDITSAYNSLNIGAVLALGAGFNLTDFLMLTTGLRFDFGLNDAEDKSSILVNSDRRPNHNATAGFEIGLRYVLRTN
jgi:hypothetical protein